ncbi:hypothetical protein P4S72_00340 [Vibrio sp. PP-XX7]
MGSRLLLKSVQASHIAALLAWLSFTQKDRIGAPIDLGTDGLRSNPKSSERYPQHAAKHCR